MGDPSSAIPDLIRGALLELLQEIRQLEMRMENIEMQLSELAEQSEVCGRLRTIPGIGLTTATAFAGSVGDMKVFKNSRCFASWLGLTPREFSSGDTRRLGGISKRGDGYLRKLLVHGGRAVLYSAKAVLRASRPLDALRQWGLKIHARNGHNKAAVAIANKLARIIWASWTRQQDVEFRSPELLAT